MPYGAHLVAAHQNVDNDRPSLRGCAVGCAVWSRFPLRPPFQDLPAEAASTQRACVAFTRIGALHVRCVAVYGWPANHAQAKERNEALMLQVLALISDGGLPTLIAGDFNVRPQSLPCWPSFRALGFQEANELWSGRGHAELPPTCKGSTRHDTALIPPVLLPLLVKISVDVDSWDFDAHAPMQLTFHVPGRAPCRSVWRKPRCWMEFQPSADKVHAAYQATAGHLDDSINAGQTVEYVDTAFQSWASLLENAVDRAMAQQHAENPILFPAASLPKSHRGRCVYRHEKKRRSLLLRSELGTATLIRPKKPSQSKPAPAPSRSGGCALFESHMCILGGVTSWLRNGMPFAVPVGMGRVSRSGCCHLSILKLSTRLGLCLSLPFRRRTGYRMSSMSSSMTVVRLHAKRPSSDRTCSGLRIGWMMS